MTESRLTIEIFTNSQTANIVVTFRPYCIHDKPILSIFKRNVRNRKLGCISAYMYIIICID